MSELSKLQREILERIKSGERCLLSRVNQYWFMTNDYKRCTTQIRVLERKGYIKLIGDGMFRKIDYDALHVRGEK